MLVQARPIQPAAISRRGDAGCVLTPWRQTVESKNTAVFSNLNNGNILNIMSANEHPSCAEDCTVCCDRKPQEKFPFKQSASNLLRSNTVHCNSINDRYIFKQERTPRLIYLSLLERLIQRHVQQIACFTVPAAISRSCATAGC